VISSNIRYYTKHVTILKSTQQPLDIQELTKVKQAHDFFSVASQHKQVKWSLVDIPSLKLLNKKYSNTHPMQNFVTKLQHGLYKPYQGKQQKICSKCQKKASLKHILTCPHLEFVWEKHKSMLSIVTEEIAHEVPASICPLKHRKRKRKKMQLRLLLPDKKAGFVHLSKIKKQMYIKYVVTCVTEIFHEHLSTIILQMGHEINQNCHTQEEEEEKEGKKKKYTDTNP